MALTPPLIRGDDRVLNITVTANQLPVDITGWEVFFTLNASKSPEDDSGAAIEKSTSSHTDPTNGKTQIILTHTDTNIEPGTYWYDIQFKDTSGAITSFKKDNVVVNSDITRRTT